MEQATEIGTKPKSQRTLGESQRAHYLAEARHMYAICAGIEYAIAAHGYGLNVQQALTYARKSRRTFYELFDSLHDAIVRMQWAMGRAVERELAMQFDGFDGFAAYTRALSLYPSADALLPSMATDRIMDAGRNEHFAAALIMQSEILDTHKAGRLARSGVALDEHVLMWAQDMRRAPRAKVA